MAKGGRYERDVARVFTEWGTGSRNPPELWRSKQSGGWKHRDGNDVGDLAPNGEWGQWFCDSFGVEVKHRNEKQTDFWHLFSREGNMDILKWWNKHWIECVEWGKVPIIVIKRNYYPPIIGLPIDIDIGIKSLTLSVRGLNLECGSVMFYQFDELLECVTPGELEELCLGWIP